VEENKFRKINSEIHRYCYIDASDQLVKTYKTSNPKTWRQPCLQLGYRHL